MHDAGEAGRSEGVADLRGPGEYVTEVRYAIADQAIQAPAFKEFHHDVSDRAALQISPADVVDGDDVAAAHT